MCYERFPLDGDIYPVILDAAWLGENKEQLFPTVNEMMNTLMSIYTLHTHATNEQDHFFMQLMLVIDQDDMIEDSLALTLKVENRTLYFELRNEK